MMGTAINIVTATQIFYLKPKITGTFKNFKANKNLTFHNGPIKYLICYFNVL